MIVKNSEVLLVQITNELAVPIGGDEEDVNLVNAATDDQEPRVMRIFGCCGISIGARAGGAD
ncbi:MAG: hypothetical protein ABR881_26650 [Candidatus Sulfotelmatobacter sp.]|jgi:hypothetical protein